MARKAQLPLFDPGRNFRRFRPPKIRRRAPLPAELGEGALFDFLKVPVSGSWLQMPLKKRRGAGGQDHGA